VCVTFHVFNTPIFPAVDKRPPFRLQSNPTTSPSCALSTVVDASSTFSDARRRTDTAPNRSPVAKQCSPTLLNFAVVTAPRDANVSTISYAVAIVALVALVAPPSRAALALASLVVVVVSFDRSRSASSARRMDA
jgi:hypothetical protein